MKIHRPINSSGRMRVLLLMLCSHPTGKHSAQAVRPSRRVIIIGIVAITLLLCVWPAHAQQQAIAPKTEIKLTVGLLFFDSAYGIDDHVLVGGSFVYYLSHRFNVEPEVLYMRASSEDRHIVVIPNVGFDIRKTPKIAVPYVGMTLPGVDVSWAGRRQATDTDETVAAEASRALGVCCMFGMRLGLKIFLNDRFYLSPEVAMGLPVTGRMTLSAGYVTSTTARTIIGFPR